MHLTDLIPNSPADGATTEITGLAYDSRKVQPGNLFAAWQGTRTDGHTHIPEALKRGAAAILCEHPIPNTQVPQCVVKDVRLTLAQAAQRFFHDPAASLKVVGITGTNGKTTTAHLVESLLQAANLSPGIIGTLGTRYGGAEQPGTLTTPESVDLVATLAKMQAAGSRSVVMEVSSHALHQQRVAGVGFDVGVFTNLTQDHLDYHGTLQAHFEAKLRLFTEHLKPQGVAVVNVDDPFGQRIQAPRRLRVSSHADADAEVRLTNLQMSPQGINLQVQTPRGLLTVHSPLMGRFNVENILAAVGVGEALSISPAHLVAGIGALARVPGRLERVSAGHEPLVLVDYAHTPDALDKALESVREITRGRLFCVFGCSGDRDPTKRGPMGQAVMRGATWAVLTNSNPRTEAPEAIAGAVETGLKAEGGMPSRTPCTHGYWVELERQAAIAMAVDAATPEDAVLIAGKGHETYQVIGSTHHAFDDRQQARQALDARGDHHA